MKRTNRGTAAVLGLAAAITLTAGTIRPSLAGAPKDIVATAASAPEFSTLVTAVKAAGLVDTLKGPGPFTVFAPTNEAFARIPKEQLAALLADKAALRSVLTYHVVSGRVTSAEVARLSEAKSVQGSNLKVAVKERAVTINGARVVKTDIDCSNGVIHVIDAVLVPKQ